MKYRYPFLPALFLFLTFQLGGCAKSAPQNVTQCGDGITQGREECDDGELNEALCPYGVTECNTCSSECKIVAGTPSFCGDGVLHLDQEECDDPGLTAQCDYGLLDCLVCDASCRLTAGEVSYCGDGVVNGAEGEACDRGDEPETCTYGSATCTLCGSDCQYVETPGGYCGDGVHQEEHEACDDGNTVSGDYCQADCQAVSGFCGDQIVQTNEVCDDGNTEDGDYCRRDCGAATGSCGDGVIQAIEVCDDGNTEDGDYCQNDCAAVTGSCGDGEIQNGEVCDDGNTAAGDYCSANCLANTGSCGDGLRQSIEVCDDGNTDDGDYCQNDCAAVTGSCGDSEIQEIENCDDGNTADGDYCSADCQTVTGACGDQDQQPNEACDDGNTEDGDYCAADCRSIIGSCGDQEQQTNEQCDDGNTDDGDYCASDCQTVTGACGDQETQTNEVCDDGNTQDGDYCAANCLIITGFCGDEIIQTNEACDDGNTEDGDYCASDCSEVTGFCGDDETQTNEGCDDGNDSNNDGCLNTCELASCGDGYVHLGAEDCDTALDDAPLNGYCVSCSLYCFAFDELVYINHNGDFSDGCEETVYAYEMGAGETELQVAAFDLDETANHYSAGYYNGILESRTASSEDGFVQKRNATGEPLWTAFLKSENNMLPADSSYTDGFIEIEVSDARIYALGHFCGNSNTGLGSCFASFWEGDPQLQTSCIGDGDCEDGYQCNFSESKCVQQITSEVDSGKQSGVLMALDEAGSLDWYVSFLSVTHTRPLEYTWQTANPYDSDVDLYAAATDATGNVYVTGRFKSSMKVFSSSDGAEHSEWPRSYCETESSCVNAGTCSDNCGVDCDGDGVAAANECLLEHHNESIGFVAKINQDGTLQWLKRFTGVTLEAVAVNWQSGSSMPEVAVGGIHTEGAWSVPFLQVLHQDEAGLNLSWQLTDGVSGSKSQRFVEAGFDAQGGLWVSGRAGHLPPTPIVDYNMGFGSCSSVTQPTQDVLIFDGNDHVALPSNQGLGYVPPFTVAGWFKVDNATDGPQTLWGGGNNYLDSHMLFIHEKRLRFQRCHSNGNCNVNLANDTDLENNSWTHFALTVEGATAKMYINGALDKEGGNANWVTASLDSSLYLGRRSSDAQGNWFSGQLDDLGIWNRALNASEIESLHDRVTLEGDLLTELLAFYEMDASGSSLSSFVNGANTAASITGATPRFEPHWCQTPNDSCPEIQSKNGADSCFTAFECAIPCFDEEDGNGRAECLDDCREQAEPTAQTNFDWLINSIDIPSYGCDEDSVLINCLDPQPGAPCCLLGAGYNNLMKCKSPNKDAAFVAHYDASGQCILSQAFYNVAPDTDEVEHVRTHNLEVVSESALVSLYHPSAGENDSASIAWVNLEGGVEGGGFVTWSETITSLDQSPVDVTDLQWRAPFLYYSAQYEAQVEMSFEVDFVTEAALDHTACLTSSCSSSGLLLKTRVDSP